jgi:hypothetical protein
MNRRQVLRNKLRKHYSLEICGIIDSIYEKCVEQ